MTAVERNKLLIVDDDTDILEFLSTLLEENFEIATASSAAEGVQKLSTYKPSIVLLDYKMPKENGFVFLDKSKDLAPSLKSVMISGYGEREVILNSLNKGVSAFIEKPVDVEEVLRVLNEVCMEVHEENKTNRIMQSCSAQNNLANLGLLTGYLVHEVSSPIMALMTYTRMLKSKADANEFDQQAHEAIDKIAKFTEQIVQISRFSRTLLRDGGDQKHRSCHLLSIVNDAIDVCSHKVQSNNVTVKLKVDSNLNIQCNESYFLQVLINLIVNAVDAVADQKKPWIRIETSMMEDQLVLKVVDSGEGISSEFVNNIFEEFFTTKDPKSGTGLGLKVVKTNVEHHQGRVYVDSEAKNTTFVMEFPKSITQVDS